MASNLDMKLREEIKKLNFSEKDEEEIRKFIEFLESYKKKKRGKEK
jgi:hypothetical protein